MTFITAKFSPCVHMVHELFTLLCNCKSYQLPKKPTELVSLLHNTCENMDSISFTCSMVYCIFILGLLHLATTSPVCYYEKTAGHALYGENTLVLKHVSLEECRKACAKEEDQCLSFEYNYDTDSCFLSDQTKNSAPDLFGTHAFVDYFEKVPVQCMTSQ